MAQAMLVSIFSFVSDFKILPNYMICIVEKGIQSFKMQNRFIFWTNIKKMHAKIWSLMRLFFFSQSENKKEKRNLIQNIISSSPHQNESTLKDWFVRYIHLFFYQQSANFSWNDLLVYHNTMVDFA